MHEISISSDQINEIRHLVSGRNLEIFTSTGEFYLKPQVGKPLTPTDLKIERQSNLGSTQECMPKLFDVYLNMHAQLSKQAYYDQDFNCLDYFVYLEMNQVAKNFVMNKMIQR